MIKTKNPYNPGRLAQGALFFLAVVIFVAARWSGYPDLVLWGLLLIVFGIFAGFRPLATRGEKDLQASIRRPTIAWIGSGIYVIGVGVGGGVISTAPTGYEAIGRAMIAIYVFSVGSILAGICGIVSLFRNEHPRLFSSFLVGIAASGIAWVVLKH